VHGDTTDTQRLIVDIDFRSHFEIARAVDSYGTLLNSLPVVYVGTLPCLKQYLHVMVDAAKRVPGAELYATSSLEILALSPSQMAVQV